MSDMDEIIYPVTMVNDQIIFNPSINDLYTEPFKDEILYQYYDAKDYGDDFIGPRNIAIDNINNDIKFYMANNIQHIVTYCFLAYVEELLDMIEDDALRSKLQNIVYDKSRNIAMDINRGIIFFDFNSIDRGSKQAIAIYLNKIMGSIYTTISYIAEDIVLSTFNNINFDQAIIIYKNHIDDNTSDMANYVTPSLWSAVTGALRSIMIEHVRSIRIGLGSMVSPLVEMIYWTYNCRPMYKNDNSETLPFIKDLIVEEEEE